MLNKNKLATLAKQILHPHKGLHSPQIMHPTREWFVGLGVAAGIFLMSIIWSAHTYLSYQSVTLDTVDVSADQAVVYRESMVKAALEVFVDKQKLQPELLPEEIIEPEVVLTVSTSTSEIENLVEVSEVAQASTTEESVVEDSTEGESEDAPSQI